MDEVDIERNELLASIRLQEEALSESVTDATNLITCISDSDEETERIGDDDCEGITLTGYVEPDDYDEKEEHKPTWADALAANLEYDEALEKLEQDLRLSIGRVDKELSTIRRKICLVNDQIQCINVKSQWIYPFGAPYFKDSGFYPCPKNKDFYTKKNKREILWSELPLFHQWIPKHKKRLIGAIRKLSFEKCEMNASLKFAGLRKELKNAKDSNDLSLAATLEDKIANFVIKNEANAMLEEAIENDEHDWMQISSKYLEGKQSPEGCRSFWLMYLHPKINKAPWSKEELNMLKKIAERYNFEDWERMAEELGTNRSGYQCFVVYQTKLNDTLKRSIWEPEEDQKLLATVEQCRIGEYIPWGKIAFHMEGRTKAQVFNRWTYSLNPAIKKGRFSSSEDIMILVGVTMWGENFQRISNFLKDRTTCQVRDRYKKYLRKEGASLPWERKDDELLVSLEKLHGRNWAKIAENFPHKDRTQVRHRFSTIQKWREAHPDSPLSDVPNRHLKSARAHSKKFALQWERAKAIMSSETVDEIVEAKEKLVSSVQKKRRHQVLKPRQKKTSVIESDLLNYFRCSYEVPGGRRKCQLRSGEADKYADELVNLVSSLNAKLNLPSIEEINLDQSLSSADKAILIAFSVKRENTDSQLPLNSGECSQTETPSAIYCDPLTHADLPTASSSQHHELNSPDINYLPAHSISSVYIDLPLLNFEEDEVVVDEKRMIHSNSNVQNNIQFLFVSTDMLSFNQDDNKRNGPEEFYVCPSNFTNLVGMRTYLLNRRTLVTWSNSQRINSISGPDVSSQDLSDAKKQFSKRLLFLFLWPALMSRFAPGKSQIFFDEEDKSSTSHKSDRTAENMTQELQLNIGADSLPTLSVSGEDCLPGTSKSTARFAFVDASAASTSRKSNKLRKASRPCSKPASNVVAEHSDLESSAHYSLPSTSNVCNKRRKLCPTSGTFAEDSDEDPDEPLALLT